MKTQTDNSNIVVPTDFAFNFIIMNHLLNKLMKSDALQFSFEKKDFTMFDAHCIDVVLRNNKKMFKKYKIEKANNIINSLKV